jgi:hypothetical protein
MAAGPSAASTAPETLSDRLKEAVKTWVPKRRVDLEKEFEGQLNRLGLRENGEHLPVEQMNLAPADREARRRAEALIAHDALAEGGAEQGYANVRRELAYTLLNRLVGLKAMEARQLLYLPPPGSPDAEPEPIEVLTPVAGQERSRYLRDLRNAGGSRYK